MNTTRLQAEYNARGNRKDRNKITSSARNPRVNTGRYLVRGIFADDVTPLCRHRPSQSLDENKTPLETNITSSQI